jgi:putative ABC transport system ATP-binding protein
VTPLVSLHNITKTYEGPPAHTALNGISMNIGEHEFVAITGRSGSGKSTLLNIVGLLDCPTSGTQLLAGTDVSSLNVKELTRQRAQNIGFVFQDFALMPRRTALDNVMVGLLYQGATGAEAIASARQALALVGLDNRADHKPHQMSGGEKQRVAIARALATSPRLLLCDEPTGNLDSHNTAGVLDLFEAIHASGTAVVVITHEDDVASRAARTIRLVDGRVA